jgi:hypothetical protein
VQYYGRLKANGRPVAVHVTGTDRAAYYRRQSRYGKSYRYTARVQFNGQERVIPLEEAGYEALRPGDRLTVLYDPSLEDMMPVDYPMDSREFIALGFAWLVSLYFLGRKLFRRARAQPHPAGVRAGPGAAAGTNARKGLRGGVWMGICPATGKILISEYCVAGVGEVILTH